MSNPTEFEPPPPMWLDLIWPIFVALFIGGFLALIWYLTEAQKPKEPLIFKCPNCNHQIYPKL